MVDDLITSESLRLLTTPCPFFLRPLDINGEEWLEMPYRVDFRLCRKFGKPGSVESNKAIAKENGPGSKLFGSVPPASPGSKARSDSAEQLLTRSPRRVKREAGGIREVREMIRRELELDA